MARAVGSQGGETVGGTIREGFDFLRAAGMAVAEPGPVLDAAAQAERQGDPHSHAIVLDPADGNIAYVPDLGMDLSLIHI